MRCGVLLLLFSNSVSCFTPSHSIHTHFSAEILCVRACMHACVCEQLELYVCAVCMFLSINYFQVYFCSLPCVNITCIIFNGNTNKEKPHTHSVDEDREIANARKKSCFSFMLPSLAAFSHTLFHILLWVLHVYFVIKQANTTQRSYVRTQSSLSHTHASICPINNGTTNDSLTHLLI